MNRAERRRQDKLGETAIGSDRTRQALALLAEGASHHQAGRLQQAESIYRQALDLHPDHPEALHLLGLLAYRVGQLDKAEALLCRAIRQDAKNPLYHFNLGVVLQKDGRTEEAAESYRKALSLNPNYVEAQNNLGNALRDVGQVQEAIDAYRRALALNPHYVEAHNNLGVAFKEHGDLDRSLASYEDALRLNPNHAEAHCNKGIACQEQGRIEEAMTAFQSALHVRPDYAKAQHGLGLAYQWQQRFDLAFAALRTSADLQHNRDRPTPIARVYRSRIKHDAEQIQYLFDRDLLAPEHAPYLAALKSLNHRLAQESESATQLSLDNQARVAIAPSFNRILHYGDSPALAHGALNPELHVEEIEGRYLGRKPEIMFVDHLLREEALQSLTRFCLESTIWKRDYENGYIGAFLGEGFCSPLILQIADELRLRFPRIFRDHRLKQAWAFKYDSALTGLNIHADAAAVNVNFWITADEANLDPGSGGLAVWDKEAPKEWNFKVYNDGRNRGKILEFLKDQNAKPVTIPYRENRAVIFNSDLFHETDRFRFKDEYESRRVNVTLLYGNRLHEA